MVRNEFSVIIPAAGRGVRLKPFTNSVPKVLLEIAGKPILGHILDQIIKINPLKIYIVTGYFGKKIERYIKDKYPSLNVSFVVQKKPKGLGHAVMLALGKIKTPVFIMLGDTILIENLKKLIKPHQNCLAVKRVKEPQKYGIVETQKNLITDIFEKPDNPVSDLAIVGTYYFHETQKLKKALKKIAATNQTTKGEMQLTDALKKMLEDGSKISIHKVKNWYDCGTFEEIICANKHLIKTKKTGKMPGCKIINPVLISLPSKIKNSKLGPYVYVGKNAHIENCTITNAIICKKTKLKNEILGRIIIQKKHRKIL
jgi:glucose-1-phosphate thymidylyltransferase